MHTHPNTHIPNIHTHTHTHYSFQSPPVTLSRVTITHHMFWAVILFDALNPNKAPDLKDKKTLTLILLHFYIKKAL